MQGQNQWGTLSKNSKIEEDIIVALVWEFVKGWVQRFRARARKATAKQADIETMDMKDHDLLKRR
eukprot:6485213-Amphidinium_carterae.1